MAALNRKVVLLAFDGVEILDVSGPAGAFGAANQELLNPAYAVIVASAMGGAIRSSCGMQISTTPLSDIGDMSAGTFLAAGAPDLESLLATGADPEVKAPALSMLQGCERYGAVSSGAMILAQWNLLKGRKIATHWEFLEVFDRLHPEVDVETGATFINQGRLWTSAGMTAGIDMALAMIEADLGAEVGRAVARRMVYQPRPGGRAPAPPLDAGASHGYGDLIRWMLGNLDSPLDVETLSRRAGQSVRSFHRKFSAATGKTPAAFVEALRLQQAQILLSQGLPIKQVATAVGLADANKFSRAFRRSHGMTPSSFRSLKDHPHGPRRS
ncbi:helix-turn-helix domain-containing protein [Caulobacter segnis]|uniref:GlxA family transcriptional regulator n=1 Tax=Caulobacter segnis TaxID=88688 RepID=UPI0024105058|nr:helix-turn-helix domain-containing protein [Caulobacter segnis]MDG2520265.1 helix-turn-helix domain-containing protein [Caulobacter segnis]